MGIIMHRWPLVQVVLCPTWIAMCGKVHPGGMHRVCRLLWRGISQEYLHAFDRERVEDEWDLQGMARAKPSIKCGRTPGKLVHIGAPIVPHMRLGQTDGGNTEKPVGENGLIHITSAGFGTCCPIGCQRLGHRE